MDQTIGQKVYAVHNKYAEEKLQGGRIKPCRIKTFENFKGVVRPVLTVIGASRLEIDQNTHQVYDELSDAVQAITTDGK